MRSSILSKSNKPRIRQIEDNGADCTSEESIEEIVEAVVCEAAGEAAGEVEVEAAVEEAAVALEWCEAVLKLSDHQLRDPTYVRHLLDARNPTDTG